MSNINNTVKQMKAITVTTGNVLEGASPRDKRVLSKHVSGCFTARKAMQWGNTNRLTTILNHIDKVSSLPDSRLDHKSLKDMVIARLWEIYAEVEIQGHDDAHYSVSDVPSDDRKTVSHSFRSSQVNGYKAFDDDGEQVKQERFTSTAWQGTGWLFNQPTKRIKRVSNPSKASVTDSEVFDRLSYLFAGTPESAL